MDRAEKKEAVAGLNEVFKKTSVVVVAHYSGLTVAQMTRGPDATAYNGDDVQVSTTTTNALGAFGFQLYTAGTYYFKVTPNSAYPVIGLNRVATDTGINNDNNAFSQPGLINTPINGATFTLAACTEPGTGGTGAETGQWR